MSKYRNPILIMIKPVGMDHLDLIENFLKKNSKILQKKKVLVSPYRISQHYKKLRKEPFFIDLIKYYTGKDLIVYIVDVDDIDEFRRKIGKTNSTTGLRKIINGGKEIRDKYGVWDNGIHASDSKEEGQREIRIWFGKPEIQRGVFDAEKQSIAELYHNRIWNMLDKHKDKFNYNFTAAGSAFNGMALNQNDIDLDYRIYCEDDPVETGKKVADIESMLIFDGIKTDPSSQTEYVKYEVEFKHGKADVAFVQKEAYKNKISASQVSPILPKEFLEKLKKIKEKSYLSGDQQLYKDTKRRIARIIKKQIGLTNEASARNLHLPAKINKQQFKDFGELRHYVKEFYPLLNNFLKDFKENNKHLNISYKGNIKTMESIAEKLSRKNTQIDKLMDILRCTIYLSSKKDVKKAAHKFHNDPRTVELDTSRFDMPESESNPYFGAIHILYKLRSGKKYMIVEIILMTKEFDKYKELAHPLYKSGIPQHIASKRMDTLFKRANKIKIEKPKKMFTRNKSVPADY